MTLRVLIADDELLAEVEGVELVAECVDAEQVIERVRSGGVDVTLLDIHMPGLSGIDALSVIGGNGGPVVIFCTAHPDHAIAAFEGGAIDYLLKPIELERLRKALERARTRTRKPDPPTVTRLPIETRKGIVLIDPARITHAVLDGSLVSLFTLDEELVTDFSLQDLERRLPEGRFIRVHRRALLALEHVHRLEPLPTGGFAARTVKGHVVEVSRQAARTLRRQLGLSRGDDDD